VHETMSGKKRGERRPTGIVCPRCKRPVDEVSCDIICNVCGELGKLDDDCIVLGSPLEGFGELSRKEMASLCEGAKDRGWRQSLRSLPDGKRELLSLLIEEPTRSEWTRLVPSVKGKDVLDMGCGYGSVSAQLASKGAGHIYAMDGSLSRLKFLAVRKDQDRLENLTIICNHDFLELPFADASMDIVSMIGVLEYFPLARPGEDPVEVQTKALAEIRRILRPGGSLYLGTKNRFGYHFLLGDSDNNGIPFGPVLPRRLADLIARISKRKRYRVIVHSLCEIRRMLMRAGFGNFTAYWPVPGYQHPRSFIRLDSESITRRELGDAGYSDWKALILSVADQLGALAYLVPHYSIMASRD